MKINKYEKERRKDEDDCYCAHRDQGCDATTSPVAPTYVSYDSN